MMSQPIRIRTAAAESDNAPVTTLSGRDMLCFSHDWNGDPLSKTHLMRLLAKRNRVLWVNSIGYRAPSLCRGDVRRAASKVFAAALRPIVEVERNLFVLNPLVIPAHGRSWVRSLNRAWLRRQVMRAMARLGFERPINWVFNPAAAPVAGTLGEETLIYYCVDDYAAFDGVNGAAMTALEHDLLIKADHVIASAQNLCEAKARVNPRTTLVRHGVDYAHFRCATDPDLPVAREIASLPRPIIGYFGLIGRDWVDVDLLVHVAKAFPRASLVMLGKIAMDVAVLRALPNVHLLGRKPYATLPDYCRGFDVAMIPFPLNRATLHANPLKAREYLAAGLPVVSTAIPEVEVLDQCRIGRTAAEFVAHVRSALADPGPQVWRSRQMESESWEARLRQIASLVSRHMMPMRRAAYGDCRPCPHRCSD